MYNGIGLQTARGSGTNGYVQRNLSSVRPKDPRPTTTQSAPPKRLEPDEAILAHDRKRKIEIECIALEDELEEQGVPEAKIEERVAALRARLLHEHADTKSKFTRTSYAETRNMRPSDTHALGAAKLAETRNMQRALHVRAEYQEGEAFDAEIQERRKSEQFNERARRQEDARQRWSARRDDATDRGWNSHRDRGWESLRGEERTHVGHTRANAHTLRARSSSPTTHAHAPSPAHPARSPTPFGARTPPTPPRAV
ncbi:RNA-splicing factor [Malassezia vespertilionis]|uniref:RNA-splicing factor n=1 Tax=Malassezia vespertilionis TaxID=2020962 RepID=UPI0024B285BB|nr:RNA-splicing factor [Malassezia vespertilionis]WFD05219.1 RNA-splicing factor [Malassezia vespertilionis]